MLINGGYNIVPEDAAGCSEGAEADVGANNPVFFGKGAVTLVRSSLLCCWFRFAQLAKGKKFRP
jgi:hypothetical protein